MADLLRVLGNWRTRLLVPRSGASRVETMEDIQRDAIALSVVTTVPDPLFPIRFLLCLSATILFVVVLPFAAAAIPKMLLP